MANHTEKIRDMLARFDRGDVIDWLNNRAPAADLVDTAAALGAICDGAAIVAAVEAIDTPYSERAAEDFAPKLVAVRPDMKCRIASSRSLISAQLRRFYALHRRPPARDPDNTGL